MPTYIFHWLDGGYDELVGNTPTDALINFQNAGGITRAIKKIIDKKSIKDRKLVIKYCRVCPWCSNGVWSNQTQPIGTKSVCKCLDREISNFEGEIPDWCTMLKDG